MPTSLYVRRSAIARAVRANDPVAEATARQEYAEAKLADAITKTLATAPPLSDEQIARLSSLLGGA